MYGSVPNAHRGFWQRMLQDEMRHVYWLQMALGGFTSGMSVDQMGSVGSMQKGQGGMAWGQQRPPYGMGQTVVPNVAHMPEQANRAARVVGIVQNQPFYVLDFGDGRPCEALAYILTPPTDGSWYQGQFMNPLVRPGRAVPISTILVLPEAFAGRSSHFLHS